MSLPLEAPRGWSRAIAYLPVLMWVSMLLVIAARLQQGDTRSVSLAYTEAANHWLASEPVYGEEGRGFLYLPHAALLFVPFASLGNPLGEILWRVCGVALFGLAIWKVSTKLAPGDHHFHWGIAFFSGLLGASCLRNGQSTLHMAALMLLAAEALHRQHWKQATLCLLLGVAVKPLAVVMVLLVGAVVPEMRWKLLGGTLLLAASLFLCQHPAYVVDQYRGFASMLGAAHELGVKTWWAQFFGMFKAFGLDIPSSIQTVIRLSAALGTLGVWWLVSRRLSPARRMVWLYSLTAAYLLLFNPRTENNTYCLLGPALGMFYADELILRKRKLAAGGIALLAVLTLGSYEIGKHLTPAGAEPIWLAPLACTVFCGYLGFRLKSELAQANSESAQPLIENSAQRDSETDMRQAA